MEREGTRNGRAVRSAGHRDNLVAESPGGAKEAAGESPVLIESWDRKHNQKWEAESDRQEDRVRRSAAAAFHQPFFCVPIQGSFITIPCDHPILPMHSLHHRRERANACPLLLPPSRLPSLSPILPLNAHFLSNSYTRHTMMQLLPSHKETKNQRKGDLFRPWDAAAAAAAQQQAKLPKEEKTSEPSERQSNNRPASMPTSIKSNNKKSRDKHCRTACPAVASDEECRSNVTNICSPSYPAPASTLNQNHMSLRMPFAVQPFQTPMDPFPVPNNMIAYPEQTRFMTDMYASQLDGVFLEAAASSVMMGRSWKLHQKKQRPKRFQCPHCQVSFSNNGQLRGHVRIHTGLLLSFFWGNLIDLVS